MRFYCSSLLHELGISHPFGMPGKRWRCRVVRQLLACAGGCRVWHRRLADWRREKEGFFLQAYIYIYILKKCLFIYIHIFLGSLHLKTTTVFISGIANGSLLLPVLNGADFMTSAGWKTVMTGTGLTLFVCSMWRLPFCTTKRDVNFRSLKGNLIPTRRRFGIQGELTSSFCSRSEGEVSTGATGGDRETWNELPFTFVYSMRGKHVPVGTSISFRICWFFANPPNALGQVLDFPKSWRDRGRHWKSSQLIGNCTPFGFPKKWWGPSEKGNSTAWSWDGHGCNANQNLWPYWYLVVFARLKTPVALGTGNGIHFLLPKKDKFNEEYWWPFWTLPPLIHG